MIVYSLVPTVTKTDIRVGAARKKIFEIHRGLHLKKKKKKKKARLGAEQEKTKEKKLIA